MRSLHDLNFSDVISFDLYFKGIFLPTSKIHVKHSDVATSNQTEWKYDDEKSGADLSTRNTTMMIRVKPLEDNVDNVEKKIGNIYGLSHYKHITLIGISHR